MYISQFFELCDFLARYCICLLLLNGFQNHELLLAILVCTIFVFLLYMLIHQYLGSMLPRCFIFRQLPAKMCHLLVGEPYVFWQLASALSVTSMLLMFLLHIPIHQYLGSMLPRCFIFRYLPAKMCHLLVGEPFVFWQLASALFVTSMLFFVFYYICMLIYQHFGSMLPRCFTFRQLPAKMCHLLVGEPFVFGSWHRHSLLLACFFCFLLHMHANLLVLRFYAAKMFHLSVATCQDVSSFGRGTICIFGSWHRHSLLLGCFFCFLLRMHANLLVLRFYAAKMFHLSVATCQDVSSFGRGTICILVVGIGTLCYQYASFVFYCICMPIYQYFGSMLPRCFIFQYLPAKMCHLLVGEPFVFWQLALALFVTSMLFLFFTTYAYQFISTSVLCCQDVSSFGSYLSRCVIFWQGNHLYFGSWHRHSLLIVCLLCFLLHMPIYQYLSSCCQDASCFGSYLPRCVIFQQGNHLYFGSQHQYSLLLVCFSCFFTIKMVYAVVCVCLCVCMCGACVHSCVHKCLTHMCASYYVHACVCVCPSLCVLCVYVHVCVHACILVCMFACSMCKIFLPTSTISVSFNVVNCTVSR